MRSYQPFQFLAWRHSLAWAVFVLVELCMSSANAASTARYYDLNIQCSEDYCPNQQCWMINVTNPFQETTSWRALMEIVEPGYVEIRQPNNSRLESTDNSDVFEIKSHDGSAYYCANGSATTAVEICTSNAGAIPSARVKVEHELGDSQCRDAFFQGQSIDDESCSTLCTPPCYCPSSEAPIDDPPQFIVISWDDAFTHRSYRDHIYYLLHDNTDVRDYCGGYPRHTFFVTNQNTDYAALSHLLNFGAEYALHTVMHENRNLSESRKYWTRQINSGIKWAKRLVPSVDEKEEFKPTGFRAPWLAHNDALYRVLNASQDITYDSSLPSFSQPIWPYTLDFGAHEGCEAYSSLGSFVPCPEKGKFPGLWEFPINPLLSRSGEIFSFDPTGPAMDILHLLKDHLRHSYEGNRAPLMLSLHSRQFFKRDAEERKRILRNFFLFVQHEYASVGKKVVFATMRQVLAWMAAGTPSNTKEELCEYFKLPYAATAPSPELPEVCDGWDNDGDDQFDEHVINKCSYPEHNDSPAGKRFKKYLYTCASCPFSFPTEENPHREDNGHNLIWRGKIEERFEFWNLDDGRIAFAVKIKVKNSRNVPSQRWYLQLKIRSMSVTTYYGVQPTSPLKGKPRPRVFEFESIAENRYVEGLGEVGDIEIGGTLVKGNEECINKTENTLHEHCWKLQAFLGDINKQNTGL